MRWIFLAVVLVGCAGEEPPAAGRPTEASVKRQVRALAPELSRSAEGLVAAPLPGGGVKLDLQGRLQSAMVGRMGPDGRVVVECVDDAAAAEAFLRAELDEGTK